METESRAAVDVAVKHKSGGANAFGTMVELLRARRTSTLATAFTFLQDDKSLSWSYAELDRRARAVAATLQDQRPDGRTVLLLFPPGLDFIAAFFGCLYAGAIPVPAYPPEPARLARTLPRLAAIAADAGARFALSTRELAAAVGALGGRSGLAKLAWLTVGDEPRGAEDSWKAPAVYPDSIAFIQYTSGSTSTPKGVIVSHANLLHNLQQIHRKVEHSAKASVVGWLKKKPTQGVRGGGEAQQIGAAQR